MPGLAFSRKLLGTLLPGLGHVMLGHGAIGIFCGLVFLSAVVAPFLWPAQAALVQATDQPGALVYLVALVLAWSSWPFFLLATPAERAGIALLNLPVVVAASLVLPLLSWVEALIVAMFVGGKFLALSKAHNNAAQPDTAEPRGGH